MRTLVLGGTGKVGSAVLAQLEALGNPGTSAARTPHNGGIQLDLRKVGSVRTAAQDFDRAFLITPFTEDETEIGLCAIDELRAAGIEKIVYLGIQNLDEMSEIPHFQAKTPIRDRLLEDRKSVMLAANFFFQNDVTIIGAIKGAGVYPMPIGSVGVNSVDCDDIGRAGARALIMDDWNGTVQPVCGVSKLTGPAMADIWSKALGRPVIYPGDEIDPFIDGLRENMPGFDDWLEHDMRKMIEVTQRSGCLATEAEIAASRTIIGQPQRRYADFVAALADAPTTPTP